MPFAQLVSGSIELTLNNLLKLDPESPKRMKDLLGKQLKVSVKELPWPLVFSFAQKIDVGCELHSIDATYDCEIALSLETLPMLKDSSNISLLIKQDKLELKGDIHIAQDFSKLIKELDIDWEELMSKYTGDVVAHQTFSGMKQVFDQAQNQIGNITKHASESLLKEDSIAVGKPEVKEFVEQVNEVRSAAARLEARVDILLKAKAE